MQNFFWPVYLKMVMLTSPAFFFKENNLFIENLTC